MLAVLNQEKDRLQVLDRIWPHDVLAACLFNSPGADAKGFSLNMYPSCDLLRLPVKSREAGKMSLRFRAKAVHLQVSLRDQTDRGFMLGFGEMSSSPLDTPLMVMQKFGFDAELFSQVSEEDLTELAKMHLGKIFGHQDDWHWQKTAWFCGTSAENKECVEAMPFPEAEGTFSICVDASASSIVVEREEPIGETIRHAISLKGKCQAESVLREVCAVGFRSPFSEAVLTDIKLM